MALDWVSTTDEEALLELWPDAPLELETFLQGLADVAKVQVLAYAALDDEPSLQVAELLDALGIDATTVNSVLALLTFPTVSNPPARYVMAQVAQMQNLYRAATVTPDGNIGPDGYSYAPRPLDKVIRAMIRPLTGGLDAF